MKRFLFAIALMLAIAGILPTTTASAQEPVVLGPSFTLLTLSKSVRADHTDPLCKYFVWTKNFSTNQRIGFSYVTTDNKTTADVPVLEDVTIIITGNAVAPIANMMGTDDRGRTIWQIRMSQSTWDENRSCLGGIAVTKAE